MLNKKSRALLSIVLVSFIGISLCFSVESTGHKKKQYTDAEIKALRLHDIPKTATPRTGHVTEYWPDGQMKSERTFKNGEMLKGTYYASNGTMIYEMTAESSSIQVPLFPKEVRPDTGTIIGYWPNGNVKSEGVFKDGKVVTAIFYTSEGTVMYEVSAKSKVK